MQSVSHFFDLEIVIHGLQIFIDAFNLASQLHGELEEGQEMISMQQFSLLLMDWINPEKSVDVLVYDWPRRPFSRLSYFHRMPELTPNKNFHAYLAVDILLALYDEDKDGEQVSS